MAESLGLVDVAFFDCLLDPLLLWILGWMQQLNLGKRQLARRCWTRRVGIGMGGGIRPRLARDGLSVPVEHLQDRVLLGMESQTLL